MKKVKENKDDEEGHTQIMQWEEEWREDNEDEHDEDEDNNDEGRTTLWRNTWW